MKVDGIGVAEAILGLVLAWSGIKNEPIGTTVRDLLKGKNPAAVPGTPPSVSVGTGSTPAAPAAGGTGTAPAAPVSLSGNESKAKLMAAARGWVGGQWNALFDLWTRESGFDNTAQNPASGAYGIAQALPYTKMPKAAWPPSAGGSASAATQISWGLSYISEVYGNPEAARAHEQSAGWY